MTKTTFNEVKAKHMERLTQFVPIVERVHGENHPEFFKVRTLFNQLNKKLQSTKKEDIFLNEEFRQLQEVTNHYKIPNDVCESYAAVYTMLEDLNQAYIEQ